MDIFVGFKWWYVIAILATIVVSVIEAKSYALDFSNLRIVKVRSGIREKAGFLMPWVFTAVVVLVAVTESSVAINASLKQGLASAIGTIVPVSLLAIACWVLFVLVGKLVANARYGYLCSLKERIKTSLHQ